MLSFDPTKLHPLESRRCIGCETDIEAGQPVRLEETIMRDQTGQKIIRDFWHESCWDMADSAKEALELQISLNG